MSKKASEKKEVRKLVDETVRGISEVDVWNKFVMPFLEATYGASAVDHNFGCIRIKLGNKTVMADGVIYKITEKGKEPYILVEAKGWFGSPPNQAAINQTEAMAIALNAPFFVVTNGKDWLWHKTGKVPGESQKLENSIPPAFFSSKPELKPITTKSELLRTLNNCQEIVWEGESFSRSQSVLEISKVLFLKALDEKMVDEKKIREYGLNIYPTDKEEDVVLRAKFLFETAKQKYPEFFKEVDRGSPSVSTFNLRDRTLYRLIQAFSKINLRHTEANVTASAYETFLENSFRGIMGQHYTPHGIADFMVKIVKPQKRQQICDPACGSGGFLIECLKAMNQPTGQSLDEIDFQKRLNFDDGNNLFGVDISQEASWITKVNMMMHGSNGFNIHCFNALSDSGSSPDVGFNDNYFDIVLTDPPCGKIFEYDLLEKFQLGQYRKNLSTEVLFLERSYRLLKPMGILGMIIPDTILSNPTMQGVREFISDHMVWKAIVSLPQWAFSAYGSSIKSSIVFLQKKDQDRSLKQGRVFMASAEHIGYTTNGRSDHRNDLETIAKMFSIKEANLV